MMCLPNVGIARQCSAPHAKHCSQSLRRRQPRIANSTAIHSLSPADLMVEKVIINIVPRIVSNMISMDMRRALRNILSVLSQGPHLSCWSRHAVTDTAMPVNLKKERLARVATWNRPSRIYFMTQESLAFVHIF